MAQDIDPQAVFLNSHAYKPLSTRLTVAMTEVADIREALAGILVNGGLTYKNARKFVDELINKEVKFARPTVNERI